MPINPKVLVIHATGDGDGARDTHLCCFCQELCDELAAEPLVALASRMPLDTSAALELARSEEAELIFVVVGHGDSLANATDLFDPFCAEIPPIPVVFNEGKVSLVLRKANRAQIVDLVVIAVRAMSCVEAEDREPTPGEVIDFRTRLSAGDRRPSGNETQDDDEPRSQLPAEEEVNINVRRMLKTVDAWAEAATRNFVELWSNCGAEDSAVYGLSWNGLLASLERLLDIRDAPTDEAQEKYEVVKRMLTHPAAKHTPLVKLARLVEVDDLAMKLLMLVLAPELDIRFQRLFGALHEDPARRHVSMGLACAIIAAATAKETPRRIRAKIATLTALRDFRLIEGVGDTLPAADAPLRIDPRLLDWLVTGKPEWLTADSAFDAILRAPPFDALKLLPKDRRDEVEPVLHQGASRHGDRSQFATIVLTGSEPGWIEVDACVLAGPELRIAPPAVPLPAESLNLLLRDAVRASRLRGHRLVVDMLDPGPQGEAFWRTLAPLLPLCRREPHVISDNATWLLSLTSDERVAVVRLPPVRQEHRVKAIEAAIKPNLPSEKLLANELAERFRLPLTKLPDVAPLAGAEAAKRGASCHPGPPDWKAAFRSVAGGRIPDLARKVPPRLGDEGSALQRVVLPEIQRAQLETIVKHAKVGGTVLRDWEFGDLLDTRGVSALFSGDSGTGKSMAAYAIASELGTDLYVVDLAQVVSKYIGETEKNLNDVFKIAQSANAVVLFDEADALFGKRSAVSDAVGRYANMEVAYLLQRIVAFDGVAILTTNLPENIDPAFDRRMRFRVEFPRPQAPERLQICNRSLPPGPHRHPSVDFSRFAQRFDMTGGEIAEGIIVPALMDAAADCKADEMVWPVHLRSATRGHLMRLGRFDELGEVDNLFPDRVESEAA